MALTKQQIEAINENGKNIIVSAGAGSGKTRVLAERVFDRVSNNKYKWNIDELLVLTFTNAAAANMKTRIRNRILLNEGNKLSVDEQKTQLNKLDNSYIMTFDAYALFLVKKYHQTLNIDKNVKIIDSNIIRNKEYEFINEILLEEYRNKEDNFINLVNDFCVKDDYELRENIIEVNRKLNTIYGRKDYVNNYRNEHYSESSLEKLFAEYEKIIINKLKNINNLLNEFSNYVENYKDYFKGIDNLVTCDNYEEIRNNINVDHSKKLMGQGEEAKQIKAQITKLLKEISSLCEFSKEELIEQYKDTYRNVIYILFLAEKLNGKLYDYKKQTNQFEYFDIFTMAITLVDKYEDIRNEIKSTFKEILIDEYQDTNDLQDEFISRIENNNVYMVGDIKQSIYRFRNANPKLFESKYDEYEKGNNGIALKLSSNFRSRREVLEFIDDVFARIMDKKIGGANYIDSHKMECGNQSYETVCKVNGQSNNAEILSYSIDLKKENSYPFDQLNQSEVEAFIIAKDIKDKMNSGFKVSYLEKKIDEKGNEIEVLGTRAAEYRDFTILIDRGTNFDTIKQILTSCGIPSDIHADDKMDDSDLISVVRALFKLLSCIKEDNFGYEFKFSYMSLARSFLIEMLDSDLYEVITNNNYENTVLYNRILKILNNIETKTISDILDEFIEDFEVYEKISKIGDIHDNFVRIDYLYQLAKSLNELGYDYTKFDEYLDNVFSLSNEDSITYKTQKENQNAVVITNIHQSKGLEYSICYYPLLTVAFNKQDIKENVAFNKQNGLIVPTMIEDKGIKQTIAKEIYKQNCLKEDISERIRLFYVALTRAKEKIVLVCPLENKTLEGTIINDEDRLSINCFKDMLDMIYDDISKYIKEINFDDYKSIINKDYQILSKDIYSNIPSTNNNIVVNKQRIFNPQRIENTSYSKKSRMLNKDIKNRLELGTKVHYYLETIDFKKPNYNLVEEKYRNLIRGFIESDIMKNKDKAIIYKEHEFIYIDNGEKKHGFIDLLMEYDDHFDIIDYKTKNIDDEHYDEQLRGYRRYIESLSDKKVNCYLYSIIDKTYKTVE